MFSKAELFRRRHVRACVRVCACACVCVCTGGVIKELKNKNKVIAIEPPSYLCLSIFPHLFQAEEIRLQNLAAVRIQRHCRAFLERRKFLEKKRAMTKIKSVMRMYLAKTEKRRREERLEAANKINAAARGWKARRRVRELRSAIMIQAARRGHIVRRNYLKQQHSVKQVQKVVRGKQARDHLAVQKAAITKIQTMVRGKLAREDLKKKNRKALVIQRNLRGKWGRIKAYWVREGQRKAASTTMQKATRGFVARVNYRRMLYAIIRMQARLRAYRGIYIYIYICIYALVA